MDRLYSWNIRRSGASMTITHSCGKIANIQLIDRGPVDPGTGTAPVVAYGSDGRRYELA